MQETGTRINKYMSQCGCCSRREADRLIEKGEVWINGTLATMGTKVMSGDTVMVHHKTITPCQKEYLLAFHKPAGIVCTTSKIDKNNVIDYLDFPERIYPVGRLDKESTGLLLLTNNGQLMDDILRGSNYHEKEYLVSVNKPVTEEFCRKMSRGVAILDTVTRPCKVEKTGEKSFRIILTQGLNRQIRRMCETLGYRVMTLQRVRIMNIRLGSLKEGTWRNIEGEERKELDALLSDSSSLSVKERNEKQRERRGGI